MKLPTLRLVFDRTKAATDTKKALVYFEIQHERVRRYISTGISLFRGQWSESTSSIKHHTDAPTLNRMLEQQRRRMMDAIEEMCKTYAEFDADAFAQTMRGDREASRITFLDYLAERIEIRPMADETRRHHRMMLNRLRSFGRIVFFSDLTPRNIALWEDWLRVECGVHTQTTMRNYHKRLSPYLSEAVTRGLIARSPYDQYKVPRGETAKIRYLTKDEVHAIITAVLEDDVLKRVRDLFVVQMYTGLAYSDMYAVDFTNAEVKSDGRYYIRQSRLKTNEEYYLVLLPPVVEVLERYGYRLPTYSNQKYNVYLKALGLACGITKPITSHVARHTFATTITLSNKVPIEIVAKMMGHSDIKTTQRYAKVLAEDVIDAFKDLEQRI